MAIQSIVSDLENNSSFGHIRHQRLHDLIERERKRERERERERCALSCVDYSAMVEPISAFDGGGPLINNLVVIV